LRMELINTSIPGVLIIKPTVHEDQRGYFFESYHKQRMLDLGIAHGFVQDNESRSQRNVLRGLHYQVPPFEQGKLIRVISGSVLDVAVDIRRSSPFFGKWTSVVLSGTGKLMLWVPPGFAHGFLCLEDNTVFAYKCTEYYNKTAERVIRWNDPDLNIDWKTENPVLSDRDRTAPFLKEMLGSLFE